MDQKINGYTAAFLKRKAKTIKKLQQVPHSKALDLAANAAGFSNWKDFIKKSSSVRNKGNKITTSFNTLFRGNGVADQLASGKMNPFRKLLIASTNELLDRGLITLERKDGKYSHPDDGHLFVDLFGYPSVILWDDIGFEELRISVWWKYDHSMHPQASLTGNARERFSMSSPLASRNLYRKFVGVTVSGWLERRTSRHLQGKNQEALFDIYTRRGEKTGLADLPPVIPKGFQAEGKFFI
jgi:hypothetical protein